MYVVQKTQRTEHNDKKYTHKQLRRTPSSDSKIGICRCLHQILLLITLPTTYIIFTELSNDVRWWENYSFHHRFLKQPIPYNGIKQIRWQISRACNKLFVKRLHSCYSRVIINKCMQWYGQTWFAFKLILHTASSSKSKKIPSEQKFTAKSIFLDDYVEFLHHHPLNILIFCG